jgi:hypothetical protein
MPISLREVLHAYESFAFTSNRNFAAAFSARSNISKNGSVRRTSDSAGVVFKFGKAGKSQ